MRYWFDTEFIDDGKTIDLISIGIVCEDGREYYAINRDCDFSKADDWVVQNVLNLLGLEREARSRAEIKEEILMFFAPNSITDETKVATRFAEDEYKELEFWAYYADYDWVVFCQLFGTMMDLPDGFPMYCLDLKQEIYLLGNIEVPKQTVGKHNALEDARWVKTTWEYIHNKKSSM